MLASPSGAVMAMIYIWLKIEKPDRSIMATGMLAALVTLTAPCAFVNSQAAFIIGLVAGVLVVESAFLLERRLKVDDPVGAISVHGTCGTWGVLSLGLFADGTYGDGLNGVAGTVRGLFYGDPSQLLAEIIGALTNFVFVFVASTTFFKIVDMLVGNRVPPEVELEGLDVPEMGVSGYTEYLPRPAEGSLGERSVSV